MRRIAIFAVFVAAIVTGYALGFYTKPAAAPGQGMKMNKGIGMMAPADAPIIPAVTGYAEGKRILFIHTETSDQKIAKLLTDMMGGSPVLLVPSLAKTPKEVTAPVYVFTNGLKPKGPMGPLGFQPDVFPSPPGSQGHSPLRRIVLVTWKNPASARFLKSSAEIEKTMEKSEVTIKDSGIVVNMPFLTWPGGKR